MDLKIVTIFQFVQRQETALQLPKLACTLYEFFRAITESDVLIQTNATVFIGQIPIC